MKWPSVKIKTQDGIKEAVAPLIISASRSTDIPAFYAEWFIARVREGYSKWVNPFNQKPQYISYEKCKVIVFWTKNPQPIIRHLDFFNNRGINYYFQFTLNNYENEKWEPNLPSICERLEIFKKLSKMIGKNKVIWRFDPIMLSDGLSAESIIRRIKDIGDEISPYTEKLVFSFVDINKYKKVFNNIRKVGNGCREPHQYEQAFLAESIRDLCNEWGIGAATCGEGVDLSNYGIGHNKCIDDCLICEICNYDSELCKFLGCQSQDQFSLLSMSRTGSILKDKGQRDECGCVVSKDIGQYNTCGHMCVYCYANFSKESVLKNMERHNVDSEYIVSN